MRFRFLGCAFLLLVVSPAVAVCDDLVVSGEAVTIDSNREIDGSIYIENGGVLTIRNCHVTLILDYDEEHHIDVADSSQLIIENSIIDSVGGQFWFELYGDDQGNSPTLRVSGADTWFTNHSGIRPFDATRIIIDGGDVEELQLRDQVTVDMNDGAAYMVFFFDGNTAVINNLDTGTGLDNSINVPGKWSFTMSNSWVEGYQIDLMNGAKVTVNSGDGIVLSVHTPGNLGPEIQVIEGITSDGRASGSLTNLGSRFVFNNCNVPLINVYAFGTDRVLLRDVHVNEVNAEDRSELIIGQEGFDTLLNCNLCQVYDDATFTVEHATIDARENVPSATSSYHDISDLGLGVMAFREMSLEELFLTVRESGTMNLHNCTYDAGKLAVFDDGTFNDYHLTVDFSAAPRSGPVPLAVTFNDESVGEAIAWNWDFGDGATSTERLPGHTYSGDGSYAVSLTVTGPAGSNSESKVDYITVGGGSPGTIVRQLIPGQAWADGVEETSWLSEMWVFNPGVTKTVELGFWPNNHDNSNTATLLTFDIETGDFLAEDDLLEFLGVPYNSVGTVVLDFELEEAQDQPLVTGARTYNDVENGTFGQYIWALPPDAPAGVDMVLPGALRSNAFRTNLGLVNGGGSPLQFTVTLHRTAKNFTVPPQSSHQLNDVFAALGIQAGGVGTAIVTAHGPGGSAYLSIIDNNTGDPTYLGAIEAMSEGYLPGCARAPGALGTQWYSDAVFANLGDAAVDIELEFLPNDSDNSEGGTIDIITIYARETALFRDLVGNRLGSSGVGTVRFAVATPIYAWARTYNLEVVDDGEATYGQTILPTSTTEMIPADSEIVYLFARGDEDFRTNVAAFNPASSAATLTLTVLDNFASQIGQGVFTVPPRSATQVNRIFEALGLQNDTEVTVIATADTPSTGYLSMVDNHTGDGITVFPAVISSTTCPVPTLSLLAPASACTGESVTLSWSASAPDAEVFIDGVGHALPASGSQQITITESTTFVGRASNHCGTGPDSSATVRAMSSITILSFTADPSSVSPGEPVTLSWSLDTTPAEQELDISEIGIVDLNVTDRTYTFQPQAAGTVTATLDVTSACGSDSSSLDIEVAAAATRRWQASGFGGAGNFLIVLFDPSNQGVAYAVSDVAGPMLSTDGGRTWTSRAIGLGNLEVSSLAIDPFDSSVLYAGSGALETSARRGMYSTTDAGLAWQVLPESTTKNISYRKYRTPQTIAPDPYDQATILTGSRTHGIWRATDGGQSWTQVHQPPTISVELFNDGTVEDDSDLPHPAPVSAVVFDPNIEATVYAAYDGSGIVKSSADGVIGTWQDVNNGLPSNPMVKGLAVANDGAVYTALASDGVYRTTDNGASWSARNNSLVFLSEADWVTSVTADPVDAGTVYATVWTYDYSPLWVTTDGGGSWSPLFDVDQNEGDITNMQRDLIANPTGEWIGNYPEPTQRIAVDPADPEHLLIATYWSLYGSENGGATWTEQSQGAQGTCVTTIAVDRSSNDRIFAAHMDAGVMVSENGGSSWQMAVPTEYDESLTGHYWNIAFADEIGTTVIYATSDPWDGNDSQVLKSTNDGSTWTRVFSNPRPAGEWMGGAMLGLAVDPTDQSTVYVSQDGGEIYRTTNGGTSWAATAGQPDDSSYTYALAVDGEGQVFAGTLFGGLWRSVDGGASWRRVLTEQDEVFRVVVSGETLYATAGDSNLWSSADGGDTWSNLTEFTPVDWGDEVNDQGWAVAVDPNDPEHIVFGIQDSYHPADVGSGAYESTDGGVTWTEINDGLGVTSPVTFAFGSDGTVFAGTWCGGIWKLPAEVPSP